MKALEILKAFAARHESAYGFNNIFVASLGDITEALEELSSIEQRIVELEEDVRQRECLEIDATSTIRSLRERIAELEAPNTCDGCMYDVVGGYDCTHWSSKQEDCCIRFNNPTDYFEPKD